jgi:hypothetical protein
MEGRGASWCHLAVWKGRRGSLLHSLQLRTIPELLDLKKRQCEGALPQERADSAEGSEFWCFHSQLAPCLHASLFPQHQNRNPSFGQLTQYISTGGRVERLCESFPKMALFSLPTSIPADWGSLVTHMGRHLRLSWDSYISSSLWLHPAACPWARFVRTLQAGAMWLGILRVTEDLLTRVERVTALCTLVFHLSGEITDNDIQQLKWIIKSKKQTSFRYCLP